MIKRIMHNLNPKYILLILLSFSLQNITSQVNKWTAYTNERGEFILLNKDTILFKLAGPNSHCLSIHRIGKGIYGISDCKKSKDLHGFDICYYSIKQHLSIEEHILELKEKDIQDSIIQINIFENNKPLNNEIIKVKYKKPESKKSSNKKNISWRRIFTNNLDNNDSTFYEFITNQDGSVIIDKYTWGLFNNKQIAIVITTFGIDFSFKKTLQIKKQYNITILPEYSYAVSNIKFRIFNNKVIIVYYEEEEEATVLYLNNDFKITDCDFIHSTY